MLQIIEVPLSRVDAVRDLWEKNRKFHEDSSMYFGDVYRSIFFEDKVKYLTRFSEDKIRITAVKHNHAYIGYCISTISDVKGEIESIHIDESYRGRGVGRRLVVDHLSWMKEGECKTIGVVVSQENIGTISFYKQLGFYPNTLYMQQKI